MEVVATKDQISPNNTVPISADPVTGTTFESPVIDTATAQASVSVRDGQTIVLGGMITRTEATTERKVPWLADLPLLGAVFRYDSHTLRRTELLIFLTPRIMKTPADYEEQKQVESERMSFSLERAEEIHGPLFSLPKPATGDSESKTTSPAEAASESKKTDPKSSGTKSGDANAKDPSASLPGPGNAISPTSMSVVGDDDPDVRNFALPRTVEGFEASQPVPTSPVKRFFKSLLP
jgi:hypothetical protein